MKTIMATLAAATLAAAVYSPSALAVTPTSNQQNVQSQNNTNAITVTVQPGDTLSAIAQANQTTYVRLFDANEQITNPDLIYPGQVVRVPSPDEQLASRPLPGTTTTEEPVAEAAPATIPAASGFAPTTRANYTITGDSNVWDRLAQCEASGNWAANTGNGFYGGLQFTLSSWRAVGGTGYPHQASREEQIVRGQKLQAMQGWGAWPVCSQIVGLR